MPFEDAAVGSFPEQGSMWDDWETLQVEKHLYGRRKHDAHEGFLINGANTGFLEAHQDL